MNIIYFTVGVLAGVCIGVYLRERDVLTSEDIHRAVLTVAGRPRPARANKAGQ